MDSLARSVIIQDGKPKECDSWAACEIIRLREENARLTEQRDAAKEMLAPWRDAAAECAKERCARKELQQEVAEQARLLGMSGEREADLRGKLERAEREIARLTEKLQTEETLYDGACDVAGGDPVQVIYALREELATYKDAQIKNPLMQSESLALKWMNRALNAEAALAALRADKERLDWLDKNELDAVYEQGDPDVGCFPVWQIWARRALVSNGMTLIAFDSDLRAAIDAARAAQGGAK